MSQTAEKSENQQIKVPVLLGPTGIGKTGMSLQLAEQLGLEILSCDSRQIYRFMDIGTAKPSFSERERIRHWLIDIIDPDIRYSAFDFAQSAGRILRDRAREGKRVLICGGTGLYFRSLSQGIGPAVGADMQLRENLRRRFIEEGHFSIFKELEAANPKAAQAIHPHDTQRAIRALEIHQRTGSALPHDDQTTSAPVDLEFRVVILTLPRPLLYRRINERVDRMWESGLWDEFCYLVENGYGECAPGMQCLGYRELFAVRKGQMSHEQAIERIKQNTRRYAKRQITWFRHQVPDAAIFDITNAYADVTHRFEEFLSM